MTTMAMSDIKIGRKALGRLKASATQISVFMPISMRERVKS